MAEEKKISTKAIDDLKKKLETNTEDHNFKFRDIPENMDERSFVSKVYRAMHSAADRHPEDYKHFLKADKVDLIYFLSKVYEAGIYLEVCTPLLNLYEQLLKENWESYQDEDDVRRMSGVLDETYGTNINITKSIVAVLNEIKESVKSNNSEV